MGQRERAYSTIATIRAEGLGGTTMHDVARDKVDCGKCMVERVLMMSLGSREELGHVTLMVYVMWSWTCFMARGVKGGEAVARWKGYTYILCFERVEFMDGVIVS